MRTEIPDPRLFQTFVAALPAQAAPFLLALSGGLDSCCLLDLCLLERETSARKLRALHVNHGLRGAASEQDEQLVRELCDTHSIPLEVRRVPQDYLRQGNLQHRAHQFRRSCLLEARGTEEWILSAHHAWDQTESLLAALMHGKLPWGLMGIRGKEKPFLRPLLTISRSSLEAWALERTLKWREDASNQALCYERNFLRHRLAAPMRQILGAELESITQRISSQLAQARDVLGRRVSEVYEITLLGKDTNCITLARTPLLKYHDLIVRELLLRLSLEMGFWPRPPVQRRLQELAVFLREARPGSWKALSREWQLSLSRDRVQVHTSLPGPLTPMPLPKTGSFELGLGVFHIVAVAPETTTADMYSTPAGTERARLRNWLPGDRLRIGPRARAKPWPSC